MRTTDRSTVAVVVSVWLATFTVSPLTADGSFLTISWLLLALLGAISVMLRRAALTAAVVFGLQLVVWAGFVLALTAGFPSDTDVWYEHFIAEWAAGILHMQSQASPMDPNNGVTLIFVCGIGLIFLLTDLLVCGLKHPAFGIAPPAALLLAPAITLGTEAGGFALLLIAVGYLTILVAEGLNSTARWTRGLSLDSAGNQSNAPAVVWRAAGLIGAPALVLTLVLGVATPTLSLSGLGLGNGPGGNGPLQLADPTLDLRRNLTQPQDKLVIQYQSDQPGGLYLRMASLPLFNSSGWSNVAMQLEPGEQLPQIPGLSAEPKKRRETTVKVLDFSSEYLPLPFAPRSIEATGSWAYDAQSLVMLSMARGDRGDAIRNLTYSVSSVDIAPDASDLANAVAGTPIDSAVTAPIPRDLPEALITLTREITADADTTVEKAAAIQSFLRSSRFTYSTEALPGNGYRALENFLLRDRKGYCEQFATSMAMMARIVGIPSRVAVGFLPGTASGNQYNVTIRDMHAWPELYFAGYGWLRFEPTPAGVTGTPPSWTIPDSSGASADPSASASALPSAVPSAPSTQPSAAPTAEATPTNVDSGFPWARTLVGSGAGLLALLLLAAPATIRGRRRSDRLGPDGPAEERVEAAWQEIRDTVLDYGGSWPDGSPRTIGGEIGHRLQSEDSDTLTRVATLVERSRYAKTFADEEATRSLPEMTADIRRGLAEPQSRWRRLRAFVLPRSLFRRRS